MCIGKIAPRVPFLKPSIVLTVTQASVAQISRSQQTGLAFLLAGPEWQSRIATASFQRARGAATAQPVLFAFTGNCKGGPLLLASISVNKPPNDLSKQRTLLPFHTTGKQTGVGELRLKAKQPDSSQQHKELGNKQTNKPVWGKLSQIWAVI